MSNSSTILTAFNDHFMEFVSDIERVFPEDHGSGEKPEYLEIQWEFALYR